MTTDGGGNGGRLSLDELIALNEEIAALVRAGVPLERGLVGVSRDVRGRLGRLAGAIGWRMSEQGQSLSEALEAESEQVPRLYRAVVEAGVRAGHLPVALEGLSTFARGLAELRRAIGLALLYPVIVLVVAYGLFVMFVVALAPRIESAFVSLDVPTTATAGAMARLGALAPYWAPIGPVLLVLAVAVWIRSGRAMMLEVGAVGGLLGIVPGMKRLIAQARGGLFAEMMAMLLEHRVPMPEALTLTAETLGDRQTRRALLSSADAIRHGEELRAAFTMAEASTSALPPMLRWLLVTGQQQPDLPAALRHAAIMYRQRALDRAEWMRISLPILLLIFIGGGAALLYGLTLFVPFVELLKGVSM